VAAVFSGFEPFPPSGKGIKPRKSPVRGGTTLRRGRVGRRRAAHEDALVLAEARGRLVRALGPPSDTGRELNVNDLLLEVVTGQMHDDVGSSVPWYGKVHALRG
jgi:hypothetical protein